MKPRTGFTVLELVLMVVIGAVFLIGIIAALSGGGGSGTAVTGSGPSSTALFNQRVDWDIVISQPPPPPYCIGTPATPVNVTAEALNLPAILNVADPTVPANVTITASGPIRFDRASGTVPFTTDAYATARGRGTITFSVTETVNGTETKTKTTAEYEVDPAC